MTGRWLSRLVVGGALVASFPAFAGDWTAVDLGRSVPLWYEYRASVTDVGTVAATTMTTSPVVPPATQPVRVATAFYKKATSAAEPLPGRTSADATWTQSFAQDLASEDRVVGFHATTNPAMRRASLWVKGGSWSLVDLHASVTAVPSFATYTISAAYGTSPEASGAHMVVGYAREKISPTSLSRPMLWQVGSSSTSVHSLPLPPGDTYGIAYGVSDSLDKANKRYACGGTGTAGSGGVNAAQGAFMGATCWDITNPSSPIAIEISQTRGSAFASSVVNRVRTLDLGPGSEGGRQTFAIGYAIQTNGAVVGFVKNLTTGAYDINTAVTGSADALLSDVALQSYADASRANVASGTVYHGPMVVGGGTTSSGVTYSPTSQPNPIAGALTPMRAIQQTRIAKSGANTAQTCNLNSQLDSSYTVEMISGVSRNGLYMIGYDNGELVLLKNTWLNRDIKVFARDAVVYSSLAASTSVTYHWAEVHTGGTQDSLAQIVWSNAAGCERLTSGLACHTNIGGTRDAQGVRRPSATPTASATYIQGTVVAGGTCDVTPVYALADLTVSVNPATNSTIPAPGTAEDWRACGAIPAGRGGNTSGNNVDVKRDFYHCGACGQSADDGKWCTMDSCNAGTAQHAQNTNTCLIGGTDCYAAGDRNPANQCKQCTPAGAAATDWSNTPNGTSVSTCTNTDGLACTLPRCENGACRQDQAIESGQCFIGGSCKASGEQDTVSYLGEPSSTRNFCRSCTPSSNQRGWTNTVDSCCTNGAPNKDVWEKGYRPATPSNISYTGTTMTSTWIPRLRDITDAHLWSYDSDSCAGDNWVCRNGTDGVSYIRSYLNGIADQEDWYWFRHRDVNTGPGNTEPRVRLVPPSGANLDLCVYWRCVNNPGRDGIGYAGAGPGTISTVSRANSPLHDGTRGISGVCSTAATGGSRDIEIHVESSGCGGSGAWDVDVFVQVKPRAFPNTATCGSVYELQWGNDQYRYDRYITCSTGYWNSPEDGKGQFSCDGGRGWEQSNPL